MNQKGHREEYKIYLFFLKWRMKLLGPLASFLLKHKFTPNFVTTVRLSLVVPVVFLIRDFPWTAVFFIILNLIMDALDGVMARKAQLESINGSIFDAVVDNFFEIPVVLAVIYFNLSNAFLGSLYLVLLLVNHITNYFVYGWGPGKYKFSYGKYFVYFSVLIFAVSAYETFDYVFVFWSVLFLVFNLENIYKILKDAKYLT